MVIHACYISNTGKVRSNNEDSILLNGLLASQAAMDRTVCLRSEDERQIYAVADGMGGHAKGEVASRSVLEVFKGRYKEADSPESIGEIILSSKKYLNGLAENDRAAYGLGTTIAGVLLINSRAIIFNCGDSRVYELRSGSLERVTRDHSVVAELFESGLITEEEMRHHPQKSILTSAIMGDLRSKMPEWYFKEAQVGGGEKYFICSDGLWESMERSEIEKCFADAALEEAVQSLFMRAMVHGGRDNISIIGLEVGE